MIIGIAFFIMVSFAGFTFGGQSGEKLQQDKGVRVLEYNGSEVKTTFAVDKKFIGRYQGHKTGYLLLNADGTGIYKYDVYGFRRGKCDGGEVHFIWGFVLDEKGEIVKFERPYGFSYPIIYMSTGNTSFQDCEKKSMVDYIMVRRDGTIAVSSSDDWLKVPD